MNFLSTFLTVSALFSLIMLLLILLYGPFTKFFTRDKELITRELVDLPEISVVIPTYNEEENIGGKLDNLENIDYPMEKLEKIVVDSGSADRTREIAEEKGAKVINIKEKGKIKALNRGIKEAKHDDIILTDADVLLKEKSVKNALKYFTGKVCAVGGRSKVETEILYSEAKKNYHHKDWDQRTRESMIDSTASLDGKFIFFDKRCIEEISEKAYTDDLQLTLDIWKKGFRAVIPEDVVVEERTPDNIKEDIEQMRRRCKLSIANSFQNLDVLRKPSFFSIIIFPMRRLVNYFIPFFLGIVSVYLLVFNPVVFGLLFLLDLILSKLKPEIFYYNLLTFVLLLSWKDIIFRRINRSGIWK